MKQVVIILLCIPSLMFAQQTINDSIYINGTYRHFITYIPSIYQPSQPSPLVFNLHGRTIVRTPRDAVIDFIDCNIDELYIEGYRVKRNIR